MKKIGELLAGYFDENALKKASGYSGLFSSWGAIAGDGLASHSRIVELERAVLLVEADHPGWIQILQTRQKSLLIAVRRKFPALDINAIAFRLGRGGPPVEDGESQQEGSPSKEGDPSLEGGPEAPDLPEDIIETIGDEQFRETLKRFAATIRKSPRRRSRR